jgi:hypothetical protein
MREIKHRSMRGKKLAPCFRERRNSCSVMSRNPVSREKGTSAHEEIKPFSKGGSNPKRRKHCSMKGENYAP